MRLVGSIAPLLLLTLLLSLGCNGATPEPSPNFSSSNTVEGVTAAIATASATPAPKWPDMVVLYSPRVYYTMDVPPAAAEVPQAWIVDAPDPANASVEGPGSAVFTIRLSSPPYPEADLVQLEELFVNSQEFREQVVPASFRSYETAISGAPGRRMLYRSHFDGGCITTHNRVSLISGEFLIILTGSVCLEEQESFPQQWIERMQTSFALKYG